MKRIRKRPADRRRVVSISLRSRVLEEVDRQANGRRSAFIEEAILARLRAARHEAVERALEAYYAGRGRAERSEDGRVLGDFAASDAEAWRELDEGR